MLVNAGRITKETVLFDDETQTWVGVLQIPELGQFFMANGGSPYPPNQQYQQQAYQQNHQNVEFNANQGFDPNQNYNQGQGFNYNVNYSQPPKKKGKVVAIVLAVVLIVVALGAAYFFFIKDSSGSLSKTQEKQATQKMSSILSNAGANRSITVEPESVEKYGSLAPLIRVTQEYYSKLQNATNTIQKEITKLDIQSVFTQKVIGNSSSIQNMKDKLDAYSKKYKVYEETVRNSIAEFKSKLNKLKMPSSVRPGYVGDIEKTSRQTMSIMEELFKAEENFLKKLDELLTFLQSRQGKYEVTNDQVEFYSDEDVNSYNEIFNSMQEYSQKEIDIQKQMTERYQKSVNDLKKSSN